MCIDIPLGSTTTLEFGLDGLVTLVTVPLTGVGGLEEVLPAATQGKELEGLLNNNLDKIS